MPTGSVGVPSALIGLLSPISKGTIFNTPIAANTNFFAVNLIPTSTPTLFRIYVCLSLGGVFNVQRRNGLVTLTENLNSGNALTANAAYMIRHSG